MSLCVYAGVYLCSHSCVCLCVYHTFTSVCARTCWCVTVCTPHICASVCNMYMLVCMCVHTAKHACANTIHLHLYLCAHRCFVFLYVHVCLSHPSACIYVLMCACLCMGTYVHTHSHVYVCLCSAETCDGAPALKGETHGTGPSDKAAHTCSFHMGP
jgi:hypothetical protein